MRFNLVIILFCCMKNVFMAQTNLIPNPSFEEYHKCPLSLTDFDGVVKNWVAANIGTPNYFNACSNSPEVSVPNNYFGYKKAYRGAGLVGIMTSNAFREYISVRLKEPLKSNRSYRLSFYSSIIQRANCNSIGLDAIFTSEPGLQMNANGNLTDPPSLTFKPDYKEDKWVYNEQCFKAKGGEQTLILGDFHYPNALHHCKESDISYYFLDEVWLYESPASDPITIESNYCNQEFPFKIDGVSLTGLKEDTIHSIWNWDGIQAGRWKSIEKNGEYHLKVNVSDCVTKEYIVNIKNKDCTFSMYVPNVFSPNHDGLNDEWTVHSSGVDISNIKVFNRIGQVVFESRDNTIAWNGMIHNKEGPSGVYLFVIRYRSNATKELKIHSGSITLIR